MMKTAVKTDFMSSNFCGSKSLNRLREKEIRIREKEIRIVDFKFYQKLFLVLISLSTILIFPEAPRELEQICQNYNSQTLCNVW